MKIRVIIPILLLAACLTVPGCGEPEPITIGFVGELTTRASGLGTSGRDGFLLAVEEINARGGINGRQVATNVQDVRMHRETALHAIRTLTGEKVSAIIGPLTSQTAVTILPVVNNAKIPIVAPTVSTNQLSGLDDYFFRVYYTNAQAAQLLAKRVSVQSTNRRIAAIYDLSNQAYTEDWVKYFQETLEKEGQATVSRVPFDLRSETLFLNLANKALKENPDAILILANAVDTAMICQQLKKLKADIPRYATGWSYSDDLIQFGGNSVEGLLIIQSADLEDPSPAMQNFISSYKKRFRVKPNFPALHAYDATRMVLTALQSSSDPEKVREHLLKMGPFQGAQSNLAVDRYGDLKHPQLHLARITDGQFIVVE